MKKLFSFGELTPPCNKGLFARFFALFFCLSLGMNVWGAPTFNLPTGTLDLHQTISGTFNSVIDNPYVDDGTYVIFNANCLYQTARNTGVTWAKVTGGGTGSADWTPAAGSIFKGSAYWQKDAAAVNTYATVKTETDRLHDYRVKNCIGAKALVKSGSNKKRTIYLNAYEITDGAASTTAAKSASMESGTMGEIEITGLNKDKEYLILVYAVCTGTGGSSDGNSNFYEIAFEKAPMGTTYAVNFDAGEGAGTMEALQKAENATVTLPECTFTAPDGYVFKEWTSNDVTITDGKFTMPAKAVTVTATWKKALGEIVKVTADGGSNKTINANIIGATVDINLSGGKKVDSGKYFGIIGSFKAGDVVNVNITAVSGGKMMIFNAKQADAAHLIYSLEGTGSVGDNIFTLENDVDAIWVYRDGTFCGWNPNINFISVTRHGDIASQVYAGKAIVNEVEQTVAAVDNVITLEDTYPETPEVALVKTITYEDESTKSVNVPVTLTLNAAETFFEGTATIGTTEYTVKAAKDARTFYTVTYYDYDGTTEISHESVEENGHVANIPDYKRDHYTLVKWVKLDGTDVDLTAAITADLGVKAKVNKVFSQSFDIERWIMDNGKNDQDAFKAELAAKGIVYSNIDQVDSLDNAKSKNNYPYLGLKLKSASAIISLMVPKDKYVVLSIGNLSGLRVQFNGEDKTIKNGNQDTIFAAADNDRTFKIISTSGSTSVIKAIQLVDDNSTSETLTISDAKYATYYNSKRAVKVPAGVTVKYAYYDEEYHFEDFAIARDVQNGTVTNIIPAGVAVVLQAETAGEKTLTYTVGGMTPEVTNLYGSDEAGDAAEISGTTATQDDNYYYALTRNAAGEASSIGFYWMNETGASFEAPVHKAFLVLPKSAFADGNAPARIVFGEQVATDIESINAETVAQKVMINGQVFILRGEKLYTTQGQLVK